MTFRTEHDSLGSMEVPEEAYSGIHTARAQENFAISKRPISVYPDFIVAYAQVKQAAARANHELGDLDDERFALIDKACQEIIDGHLHDQFVVGVIQGGAGTSTNMNVNEVIANRALELAGRPKGDYDYLSPLDHVNRSQSTNDTYPSAVKLAAVYGFKKLIAARPGVPRLRVDAGGGHRPAPRRAAAHARDEPRRHGHRYWHHRARGVRRRGGPPPPADHR